jgi:hypothetical protein
VAVPSEDLADKYWWECVCVYKLSPRGLHFFGSCQVGPNSVLR